MKKILSLIIAVVMIMGTIACVSAEGTYVAKIGTTEYADFNSAMTAANAMSGEVTVEIYGKVEYADNTANLTGAYDKINFVGNSENAEISITRNGQGGYLSASKSVTFTDLILSKPNGYHATNAGHMNCYFSIQGGTQEYSNCKFPNGACANTATATYTNCTFQNTSEYGLWVYDDALVTVEGGTIDSKKGIKVYSEGETSVTSTLTVKNATFTEAVTSKPAVAIGYAESVTLIGNTYNNTTGVLELDSGSDADCNGIAFVAQDAAGNDITSTIKAVDRSGSNAACGVLMDGKIYLNVAAAAEEAVAGNTVTLLYNTTETVELPEGVTLNKNGYEASNVTGAAPAVTYVAKVGTETYESLLGAINAAVASNTENIVVELLNDAVLDITAWDTLAIGGENTKSITIDGNDKTLTFNKKNSDWNHIATNNDAKLILNDMTITDSGYNNGPWNRYDLNFACDVELNDVTATKALAFKSDATLKNVKINEVGDNYAIWITSGGQNVTIDGLEITSAGRGIKIDEQYQDAPSKVELSVKNATFATEKKAAILVKSAAGADVEVENVNITNVKADNVNAVWVDSDSSAHYGKVTVTGANVAVEGAEDFVALVASQGKVEGYYATLQEALDAAAAGEGNVTVDILENINLTDVDWNPVTVSSPKYPVVTVNGNGKIITGLNDMLFAGTWAGGSGLIINDLTIADSAIVNDKDDAKGTVGVGAFIGFPQASATVTLNNCHLVNSSVEGGHWTGGLIGYAAGYAGNDGPVFMNLTINNCSVTGSTITGKGSAGGIIGHATGNAWTQLTITDTTVSGNTVTSTGSSTNKAGAVIGTIGAAGQATTVNGEEKTGGVFVAATVSGNNVTSNSATITTIYGRQGTDTGMLYVTGGKYDNYPIEENVAYAAPIEGYEIADNGDGTYSVKEELVIINLEWMTGTDAGFYTVEDTPYGMMRFLFAVDIGEENIVETGIKYIKTANIEEEVDTATGVQGTESAFYGDVTGIPEGTDGTYLAVAYVKTAQGTYWSDVVECSPDFTKHFTEYQAQ